MWLFTVSLFLLRKQHCVSVMSSWAVTFQVLQPRARDNILLYCYGDMRLYAILDFGFYYIVILNTGCVFLVYKSCIAVKWCYFLNLPDCFYLFSPHRCYIHINYCFLSDDLIELLINSLLIDSRFDTVFVLNTSSIYCPLNVFFQWSQIKLHLCKQNNNNLNPATTCLSFS